MSYKSQPFDYEPVRRRGAGLSERTEDEERFSLSRSESPSVATGNDDWLASKRNLTQQGSEETAPPTPATPTTKRANERAAKRKNWVIRHGHTLSFVGLFLFTAQLYFRPHETFEAFASLKTLAFWIAVSTLAVFAPTQLGLEGNLTARPREVNLILLLSLAALLSVPLSLDPAEAWTSFVEFFKVIVMFIVMVNVMRTERRLKILIFLSLAVGCIVSGGGISDYNQGRFMDHGQRIKGIIGGMFATSNDMALHLVIMVPIAVALFFSTRSLLKKGFYGACAILLIVGNVVTFSRGGLLGLLGALAVLLWKLGRRHRLLVFVLAIGLVLSLIVFLPGAMVERIASVFDPGTDISAGASAVSRQALLITSIGVMLRHPLLGVGIGNFHIVSIHEQVSHNAYTQVGAEMGVAAMIFYLMFMVAAFKRVSRIESATLAEERHSRFYYLSVGLQASLVGYMICSFFLSVAYQYYLYYLIGYAICLHRIYEASQRTPGNTLVGVESQTTPDADGKRNQFVPLPELNAASGQ